MYESLTYPANTHTHRVYVYIYIRSLTLYINLNSHFTTSHKPLLTPSFSSLSLSLSVSVRARTYMETAMKLWTLQNKFFIAFLCVSLTVTVVLRANASSENERKTYIVYMGGLPKNRMSLMDAHNSLLSEAIGDAEIATTSMIHTYEKSFNGFAARLLPREAELLSQKEGVVSVFENQVRRLVTTRSWDFIGMPLNITRNHQTESDTIVALFDSGIWPDSPSFDDTGFGPPPSKWKGKCDSGPNFTRCNNKVIGARYFNVGNNLPSGVITPGDNYGHGTHTASTAAGNAVADADLYGISRGTARGGVPSARVASYKVCWGEEGGCQDADILAAFDAAISEGVDVISASIAGGSQGYLDNSIAIGSFHAARSGILTLCAAGNSGPGLWSVKNVVPWVVTVGASTVDRRLVADVLLGNGQRIPGSAINVYEPKKPLYPLTSGAKAQNITADLSNEASSCYYGTMSKNKVQGRVVYCNSWAGEGVVGELGGVGIIMTRESEPYDDVAYATARPGTYVSETNGAIVDKYINSTRAPRAVIMKTTTAVQKDAPAVASFSSRGPQTISPHILKPDITAPGVNILAAYTKHASLSGQEGDNRIVTYNIQSGTSMACPHAAGAAAYVKTFHPNWSPAAIRSALMTTAKEILIKPAEAELAYGSGVINPKDAIDPGLVYDIDTISYISFLCKEGYTDRQIATLTGDSKHNCSDLPKAKGYDGLNYPSVYLQLGREVTDFWAEFHRTVTNVGDDNGGHNNKVVYKAEVTSPKELSVTVEPSVLTFDGKGNKTMSFKVVLKGKFPENATGLSGSITWTDSVHRVRSPVFVFRSNYI